MNPKDLDKSPKHKLTLEDIRSFSIVNKKQVMLKPSSTENQMRPYTKQLKEALYQ